MNRLTQEIIKFSPSGMISGQDLATLLPEGDNKRQALIKRAIASGDLVHIRRGLYSLAPMYQKKHLSPLSIAQNIYGPSYISLESALRWHDWIPEAVYSYTSVSLKNSKDFDTPVGMFSYRRVPQKTFYAGVNRQTDDNDSVFLIASPLKALADYVYVHKCDWCGLEPVVESLRVEMEELGSLTSEDFDVITGNYNSRRVQLFYKGLRKDLKL
jgi:predicted transcriptional regulator of viral defense system